MFFQSTEAPLVWARPEPPDAGGQRGALESLESGEVRWLPSPVFLRGGNGGFQDQFSDAQLLQHASYRDALKSRMRYQPPGARLIFLPHWLVLLGPAMDRPAALAGEAEEEG
jgi:hypothetical protein